MEDDLMFNLEDINISQETLDYISDGTNTGGEDRLSTQDPKERITPGNDDTDSTTINSEPAPDVDEKDNDNKPVESDDTKSKEATAEKSSQEETPSSDKNSSHDSTLYALAQYLKEEGVLFIEDDLKDIKSLEDLKGIIESSNKNARYANLNDSQKRYQEALENGIPKREFEEVEKEIQTFSGIKEADVTSNSNLRYEIIAIDLMNQGISQDKAMKLAKLSLTDESNVQDAKDALANIITAKTEKFKELVNTKSTANTANIDEFKKHIYDKEQLLDMKMNDITKNKLFDLITTKVDSDEEGRPLNDMQRWQRDNPVESSVMLNYLYMMTEKGKNMKLIKQSTGSDAAKELERKLKNMSFDSNGSLIIPDQMLSGSRNDSDDKNNKNKNNLTINI